MKNRYGELIPDIYVRADIRTHLDERTDIPYPNREATNALADHLIYEWNLDCDQQTMVLMIVEEAEDYRRGPGSALVKHTKAKFEAKKARLQGLADEINAAGSLTARVSRGGFLEIYRGKALVAMPSDPEVVLAILADLAHTTSGEGES